MSAAPALNDEAGLDRILARVSEVPVLPHVVYKVMEISGSAESSSQELERAIVIDPGFSSKLLSLANSAYYGLPRRVTSVSEAITFLGFKSIRQLAMTVGVFDLFIGKNDKDSLRRRRWWRHSVDSAVCCRWLAKKNRELQPESAYTVGLLHIIGKTLLDRFGEEPYEKVEMLMEHGVDDLRAELAVYKCDHIQVGVAAASQWGFPDELVVALEYDRPAPDGDPWATNRACVMLGSRIADLALVGQDLSEAELIVLPTWALEQMGFSQDQMPDLVSAATQVIGEAASIQL